MTHTTPENTNQRLTPEDFAVLGLRFSEARTAVIRKAARQTSRKLRANEIEVDCDSDQATANIADVAIATYRILDPRRRRRFWERLNLSMGVCWEDETTERKRVAPWKLPELPMATSKDFSSDSRQDFNVCG